jgi:hypothetical protein
MYYSKIGHLARNFFYKFGIKIDKSTDPSALAIFFKKIRPVEYKNLIRLGGDSDGGYLVPNDFEGIKECYSPGVSLISNFGNELSKLGITCHMADFSVDGPALHNPLFVFKKKFLGPINNDMFIRLDDWISETTISNDDLILQMDIEGAEWSVLASTHPIILKKFRIIILEVHSMDDLFDPLIFRQIDDVFTLLKTDFEIVHIHPNNSSQTIHCHGYSVPSVMEFTFLRRDRLKGLQRNYQFPHHLDAPNDPSLPDYPLPDCWFR